MLPYSLVDARIARTVGVSADRVVHVIKLTRVEDVDQQLRGWLTEAYDAATG